ncbi:MAG: hypothetical protein HYY84_06670 [Deltaproteobacteria bacterium]|nr:hypothetical protein [Deltaproteobacteria bacterium]
MKLGELCVVLVAVGVVACDEEPSRQLPGSGGTGRPPANPVDAGGGGSGGGGGIPAPFVPDAGIPTTAVDAGSPTTPPPIDAGAPIVDAGGGGSGSSITSCTSFMIVGPCASCVSQNCSNEATSCFGTNWTQLDFSGGKCQSYFECTCRCAPRDGACNARCPNPDFACISCLAGIQVCQRSRCAGICP